MEIRALLLFMLAGCSASPMPEPLDASPEDVAAERGGGPLLRVIYPDSPQGISARGSAPPLSWERGLPMRRVAPDRYELRLPSGTGPLTWKPLLGDQQWARGGNFRAAGDGAVAEACPTFTAGPGRYARRYEGFNSKILNNQRGVWVYLPAGYDENPRCRYPVVYMHDGQNLFDARYAFGGQTWRVAEALDEGTARHEEDAFIPPVIVVGPENTSARIDEYTPVPDAQYGGGRGDDYLRFLIEELKPVIDRDLRTRPEGALTTLVGSSLGGLISAYAGAARSASFGRVGALSPSTWWSGGYLIKRIGEQPAGSARAQRVYVDSGDSGASMDDVENTRLLAEAYRRAGYRDGVDLRYLVQRGARHEEPAWAARLPGALRFLLAGLR